MAQHIQELMESSAVQAAENIAAQHPIVVAAATGIALGAVALARKLQEPGDVWALDAIDMQRYNALIDAKNKFFDDEITADWTLTTENKPTKRLDFAATANRLKAEAEKFRQNKTYYYDILAMLLSHISALFDSISQRWRARDFVKGLREGELTNHIVRPDGVEAMFYSDLSDWLLCTGAKLLPEDPRTIVAYKKLLDYCEEIQFHVIPNRHCESDRNNPYATIIRLINILKNHHNKLQEFQDAMTFNQLIGQLDGNLLGLSSSILNVLYLLIQDIPAETFLIDKFKTPQLVDSNQQAAKKTKLGEWLNTTVTKAGLDFSTFNPNHTVTIEDVAKHLMDQRLDDVDFMQSKFNWGHRRFVLKLPEKTKSILYLKEIKALHRLVLEIYCLSKNLLNSSKVAEHFGATWIYGNPAGKATLLELLLSITEVINEVDTKFFLFWKDYFHDAFRPYADRHHLNNTTDLEYKALVRIQTKFVPEINRDKLDANNIIQRIKENAEKYIDNKYELEQSKSKFIAGVLEHRHYRSPSTKTSDYELAEAELKRLLLSQSFGGDLAIVDQESAVYSAPLVHRNLIELPGRISMIQGDGNCFFRAIESEITRLAIDSLSHDQLRARGVAYLQNNRTLLADHPPENETEDEYLARMITNKSWAEGPIIEALAKDLEIKLVIFEIKTDTNGNNTLHKMVLNENGTRGRVNLVLQNEHYNVLKSEEPTLIDVTQAYYQLATTPTLVVCKQGTSISLSEAAIAILFDMPKCACDIFDLNHQLLSITPTADKFYSKQQQRVYCEFLMRNNSVITTWWRLSFLQGISSYKMEAFYDLYTRINVLMKQIYQLDIKPTAREITMLDAMMCDKINQSFTRHQFYNFAVSWDESPLKVTKRGQTIDISFDSFQTSIVRENVVTAIKELMPSMQQKEQEIALLKDKLAAKDEIITAQSQEITAQAQEIVVKNQTIAEQDQAITAITNQNQFLGQQMDALIERLNRGGARVTQTQSQRAGLFSIFSSTTVPDIDESKVSAISNSL